ncbi:MAG TPA: hypothetical protein VGF59_29295 [Bryobacteraceae bacterium]|jgi:chromosome segregation ATPase
MRYASLLLLGAAVLPAQTPDPDTRLIQTLTAEVRELRLAIERSTLLGSRTQLAISRLQLQQTAAAQAIRDLDAVRRETAEVAARRVSIERRIKGLEEHAPLASKPEERAGMDQELKELRLNLEIVSGDLDRRGAREAELGSRVSALQAQVSDAEGRITQMERSLDEAIQQLLKPH